MEELIIKLGAEIKNGKMTWQEIANNVNYNQKEGYVKADQLHYFKKIK